MNENLFILKLKVIVISIIIMIIDTIRNHILNLDIFKDYKIDVQISSSSNEYGDYQTNFALKNFKQFRCVLDLKKPIDFANLVAEKCNNDESSIKHLFESVTTSVPGFINFKLSDKYILAKTKGKYSTQTKDCHTIIDYSSPNIAKEMHVGHLRSTIIGDVIGNLLEVNGENVSRINHIGDWGTQFGMLIQYIKHMNIDINDPDINLSELHKWYKDSKKIFDSDDKFNKEAHNRVVELQSGDKYCLDIWKKLCIISESSYNSIYKKLNVSDNLKVMGESFYNEQLPDIVTELTNKNLLIEDEGAKIMFPIEGKPPLIIQKSDGGYGYDTTDLAAIKYRIQKLNANKIIYVTDLGQSLHFQLIFKAAEMAGWTKNIKLEHVGFGVVLGEDGKRIKSRSGDSIKLNDLIEEADTKFYTENYNRLQEGSGKMQEEDIEYLSKIIGSAAIKYADLRQNRLNNYQFSYEKMLDHKGDTIIYQLYSWVRILGVLSNKNIDIDTIKIDNELDRKILIHILQFDEYIERCANNLMPNIICEYLYTLSNYVNEYWNKYKILGSDNEGYRLALLFIVKQYMHKCFSLLGIDANKVLKL